MVPVVYKWIRLGLVKKEWFKKVKDPHTKATRLACTNHRAFLTAQSSIISYYETLIKDGKFSRGLDWVWNILHTVELSCMLYKYCTLKGIEHPQVAGMLHNMHYDKTLRNKARKSLVYVPVQPLLYSAN